MTEIVNGEIRYNELTKNANGGTELQARRILKHVPKEFLEGYQIIHSRVRELEPDLKKILVVHDLHNDPELGNLTDPDYRSQFEKIVFVSNWQANMFHLSMGIPYKDFVVIKNSIDTFPEHEKEYDGTVRLIYHTTPHRGLGILVPVVEALAKYDIPNFHLDVFSSFSAYGWEERDEPYRDLFNRIEDHPNMTYHGFQPNEVVREALMKSHIFAYPNIWPETSCLAAIEALASGNLVVHPNFAALPETLVGLGQEYQFIEDQNAHAYRFHTELRNAIHYVADQHENYKGYSHYAQAFGNLIYNNENMAHRWSKLLAIGV